jgi:two-component system LytT family response regulator
MLQDDMQPSPEQIRVLVVDDEAPARKRLTDMLAKDREIGAVIEAENGAVAVALIQKERPDVVFLDVQMPGVDGFGVIDALGAANMPLTVFVTGYDRFALQAFDNEALDYLLKPFGDTRYEQTMDRVKRRLREVRAGEATNANPFGPELLELASRRFRPGEIWRWIAVRNKDSTRLVMTEEVDWIEAAGVYVTLHVGAEEFLHRAGLAAMMDRLDPFQFVRIHRSAVVNLRSIAALERRSHGEFEVVLRNNKRLTLSRSYRAHVESMLGQPL